jgi:Cyclic nucleotide-binding domain
MLSPKQTIENATKSPLLWGLPEHLSGALFKGATPVRLEVNQALFYAGDDGDGCYRVDDGLLKVTMPSPFGSERILAFLGSGTIVGELSIIDGLPRSASVVAVRPAALSFVSRAAFKTFAKKHPELNEYLVTLLAARDDCGDCSWKLLVAEGPSRLHVARIGGRVWSRRRRRTDRHSPEDWSERSRGNDRHRA